MLGPPPGLCPHKLVDFVRKAPWRGSVAGGVAPLARVGGLGPLASLAPAPPLGRLRPFGPLRRRAHVVDAGLLGQGLQVVAVDHLWPVVQVDVRDRRQRLPVSRGADLHASVQRATQEQQDGVLGGLGTHAVVAGSRSCCAVLGQFGLLDRLHDPHQGRREPVAGEICDLGGIRARKAPRPQISPVMQGAARGAAYREKPAPPRMDR